MTGAGTTAALTYLQCNVFIGQGITKSEFELVPNRSSLQQADSQCWSGAHILQVWTSELYILYTVRKPTRYLHVVFIFQLLLLFVVNDDVSTVVGVQASLSEANP